jgi:hypothetical protein
MLDIVVETCVGVVGGSLDGEQEVGKGNIYKGYMIEGDGTQATDCISVWVWGCGGSARERLVGATCSGVINMAEVRYAGPLPN